MLLLLPVLTLIGCAPAPAPAPPTRAVDPAAQGPQADLKRVWVENRVQRLNADGSPADPPLTPVQASGLFGGLIMLLGGFGAFWMWRRADIAAPPGPEGVVRNSAGPPGSLR